LKARRLSRPPTAEGKLTRRGEHAALLQARPLGRDSGHSLAHPSRGSDLWLGLVPRQFTTGGKPKLLGITKRGNKYLRRHLIHGARAALPYVAERDTPLGRWAKELMSRAHRNVAVVAFANKLARIAWAVLRRGERFAVTEMPIVA
jgi:transposase